MMSILQTIRNSDHGQTPTTNLSDSPKEDYMNVEFEGIDDTWDPKNFSYVKKWLVLSAVMHGAVIVTCASSIYVSSPSLWRYESNCRPPVTSNLKISLGYQKLSLFLD
jgi:hypothetical protein